MAIDIPESPRASSSGDDCRLFSPAASRNATPIAELLDRLVPTSGTILELASGTGEHVVNFARRFPEIRWQPSDICERRLASIRAWVKRERLTNVADPIFFDAGNLAQPDITEIYGAVICINLAHLVSDETIGRVLLRMVQSTLEGGFIFLYGPFRRGERFSSEGDRALHDHLVAQDPSIGLKDLKHIVKRLRDECGLDPVAVTMPANNIAIVAQRPRACLLEAWKGAR